jgi:glucose/arabinose dehydrogenase
MHFSMWFAALLLSACGEAAPTTETCTVVRNGRVLAADYAGAVAEPGLIAREVLRDCGEPVDIQFTPGSASQAVIVDQGGRALWVDLDAGTTGLWLKHEVATGWERGLLGVAFHPKFKQNGRVFFNWTDKSEGQLVSRVGAFKTDPTAPFRSAPVLEHVVYEVAQPFSNHNGGGLAFGPDGLLYIGFGDGGKAADPYLHGQNANTALGAMLRLDVDGGAPYAIPPDNPFVGAPGLDEVWATGLRNPWRFTFDGSGRMVAADVGQDKWEEVTFVVGGANHGWNVREGRHCFSPKRGCKTEGFVEPLWEYDHSVGQSITGGYVAAEPAALAGHYVVGDFVSGRVWHFPLPDHISGQVADAKLMGRFNLKISSFGVDGRGRIYMADWAGGRIVRFEAAGG